FYLRSIEYNSRGNDRSIELDISSKRLSLIIFQHFPGCIPFGDRLMGLIDIDHGSFFTFNYLPIFSLCLLEGQPTGVVMALHLEPKAVQAPIIASRCRVKRSDHSVLPRLLKNGGTFFQLLDQSFSYAFKEGFVCTSHFLPPFLQGYRSYPKVRFPESRPLAASVPLPAAVAIFSLKR